MTFLYPILTLICLGLTPLELTGQKGPDQNKRHKDVIQINVISLDNLTGTGPDEQRLNLLFVNQIIYTRFISSRQGIRLNLQRIAMCYSLGGGFGGEYGRRSGFSAGIGFVRESTDKKFRPYVGVDIKYTWAKRRGQMYFDYRDDEPVDYKEQALSAIPILGLTWPLSRSISLRTETGVQLILSQYRGSKAGYPIHKTKPDLLWQPLSHIGLSYDF